MDLKILASLVAKFAPQVASALLGGKASGIAISLLENVFGVKMDALETVINADPDASIKLQELELKHGEILAAIDAQNFAVEVSDKKDARTNKDWVVHFIAIIYIAAFFMYTMTSFMPHSSFDKGVFHDLLNLAMLIFSFYFGSSYKIQK